MKRLIIARYKEDITWLDKINDSWLPMVVQKGTEEQEGDIPNRGREPTSFLYAILKHYDNIEPNDVLAFVQGDPFPHTTNFIDNLNGLNSVEGFSPIAGGPPVVVTWKATGHKEVFKEPFISDGQGNPHHPGVPVGEWYTKWMGKEFPNGGVAFYPGGQFIVPGSLVTAKPRSFWQQIYDDTMAENDATPYVLERLWFSLFTH